MDLEEALKNLMNEYETAKQLNCDLIIELKDAKTILNYIENSINKDRLIEMLEKDNNRYTETVKYYENAKRNCYNDFYEKSYQNTIHKLNAKREVRNEILTILEERKQKENITERRHKNKEITIELSSDIDKPDAGIIGGFENGKKVVSFYKVDRNQYEPKLELGKATTNKEDLTELMENADLIGKLVFHHQESIESLMLILREIYKV